MVNWATEPEKFAPGLSILVLQGADRKEHFQSLEAVDLMLTTYPLLAHDQAILAERGWHMIFLDEAQVIKNANAATTKLVHGLKSPHRFCLNRDAAGKSPRRSMVAVSLHCSGVSRRFEEFYPSVADADRKEG
ncbi:MULTISPECIES: SNF2-related protein [unclassified Rhizobium]|uniref:SNF2-related protein n=2 Tax=unclassified Rhizobium TaxID=2613769 RepID=UPI00214B667D|nr:MULTISPECIES: SNF2-related protein [unclassified Rhizobium]